MSIEFSPGRSGATQDNELLLPSFIQKRSGGVFVHTGRLPLDGSFRNFVERVFLNNMRFSGLDYAVMLRLSYEIESTAGQQTEIRLADDIVPFPEKRKDLYKEVRLMDRGARAEYMFEPVYLEVNYQEPVYGEADDSGIAPIIEYRQKTKLQPTSLDVDEFIADMWQKGVRFGIDVDAVKSAIASGQTARVVAAREREPIPGKDAELQEACEGLHRDDSPLIKASGKADLRRFKNRFPQIAKGQRMMKKIPRQLGVPGFLVTGEMVDPDLPKDIDLNQLAGPGTRIEGTKEGDFIVAISDGFLSIDMDSNQISVTEKIENKGGVSAKTTGDLTLTVEDFVERGEVQEGRVVEGKHMTFHAAVYGTLLSSGGNIVLEDNLAGGCARSPGGSITVKRRASNATLEAWDGSVDVSYAENCLIIGREVTIEHAINCDILAEKIQADLLEGCSVTGLEIEVSNSDARKDIETLVTMLVPDPAALEKQTAVLRKTVTELQQTIAAKNQEMEKIRADQGFAKFLSIRSMVRDGKIQLSPEQQLNFRDMINRYTPAMRTMEKFSTEKQELMQKLEKPQAMLNELEHEHASSAAGRKCSIAEVAGETYVQQFATNLGVQHFADMPAKDLRTALRQHAPAPQRIFGAGHGSVNWSYKAAS